MKVQGNNIMLWLLLLILQLVICNYLYISPLLVLTLLPAIIFCLPATLPTVWAMLIAFAAGAFVDLLGDGLIGLNALAAVPVALVRRMLLASIFGSDTVERGESISIYKNGFFRIAGALGIVISLFLAIYLFADNAGTRSFWFNLLRFAVSFPPSLLVGLLSFNVLNPKEKR